MPFVHQPADLLAVAGVWPVLQEQQGCLNQLRPLGVAPESVRFVLQSHLHLDHTGAVGRLPNATHVVQRREHPYAFTPDWFAAAGYIRKDFDRPGLKWQFLEGEATDYYDLDGDGSIVLVFTPVMPPGINRCCSPCPEVAGCC
jgi:glyoxylase-like metal-dependent hydrolase (beta-lactamase superfamily II)